MWVRKHIGGYFQTTIPLLIVVQKIKSNARVTLLPLLNSGSVLVDMKINKKNSTTRGLRV